jgi:hypothetical protein
MDRRTFLRRGLAAAAATLAVPAGYRLVNGLLVPEEPRRRFWQVGRKAPETMQRLEINTAAWFAYLPGDTVGVTGSAGGRDIAGSWQVKGSTPCALTLERSIPWERVT